MLCYKNSEKAFSLLELMVVIAIMGILSAIAIPCYNKYIIKARILDVFAVANAHKLQLTDSLINNSQTQTSISKKINNPSEFIATIEYLDLGKYKQALQVTANMDNIGIAKINNIPLVLKFTGIYKPENDLIFWSCEYNAGYADWVSKSCIEKF